MYMYMLYLLVCELYICMSSCIYVTHVSFGYMYYTCELCESYKQVVKVSSELCLYIYI